ncbi:MAG: sensor histidine kinase [Chloroflexota bacterium]
MKIDRKRDALLAAALVVAIGAVFWVDKVTPVETPVAVLYALPLFLAGTLLADWVAVLIGAAAVGLYVAEAFVLGEAWNVYRWAGLAVLIVACWWAVQTGRDQARLRSLTAELASKATELERLRLDREAMNSIVAHELRGALSSVAGYSKLLLRRPGEGPDRDALRAIANGSDRLDRLTQDLLDEANLELGHFTLNRQAVDAVRLVREQADFYQELTGRQIELNVPTEPVFGNWDELRVTQVIRNLLSNALKYSPEAESIKASISCTIKEVALVIRNTAVGVKASELDDLFLPYRRLEAHRQMDGSGLGLHVTKSLVERHGGQIAVSLGGDQIEFRVTLPR